MLDPELREQAALHLMKKPMQRVMTAHAIGGRLQCNGTSLWLLCPLSGLRTAACVPHAFLGSE
jgi:hypothetical protein